MKNLVLAFIGAIALTSTAQASTEITCYGHQHQATVKVLVTGDKAIAQVLGSRGQYMGSTSNLKVVYRANSIFVTTPITARGTYEKVTLERTGLEAIIQAEANPKQGGLMGFVGVGPGAYGEGVNFTTTRCYIY